MVVDLDGLDGLDAGGRRLRTCVELGHAIGNQHWPAVVKEGRGLRAADRRPHGHGLGDEDPRLRGHPLRVRARRRGHPVPRAARGAAAVRRGRAVARIPGATPRSRPPTCRASARLHGPRHPSPVRPPRRCASHAALLQFGDSMLPVGVVLVLQRARVGDRAGRRARRRRRSGTSSRPRRAQAATRRRHRAALHAASRGVRRRPRRAVAARRPRGLRAQAQRGDAAR